MSQTRDVVDEILKQIEDERPKTTNEVVNILLGNYDGISEKNYEYNEFIYPKRLDSTVWFTKENNNSLRFLMEGFSSPEDEFTWLEGKKAVFLCSLFDARPEEIIKAELRLKDVFNGGGGQNLIISVNNKIVFNEQISEAKNIEFEFKCPNDKKIEIVFGMPDSKSPSDLGMSADSRKLSFAINSLIFQRKDAGYSYGGSFLMSVSSGRRFFGKIVFVIRKFLIKLMHPVLEELVDCNMKLNVEVLDLTEKLESARVDINFLLNEVKK